MCQKLTVLCKVLTKHDHNPLKMPDKDIIFDGKFDTMIEFDYLVNSDFHILFWLSFILKNIVFL